MMTIMNASIVSQRADLPDDSINGDSHGALWTQCQQPLRSQTLPTYACMRVTGSAFSRETTDTICTTSDEPGER